MSSLATWTTIFALKDSPALTGTPTAPTAAPGTNTTQIATTAFVGAAVTGGAYTLPAATTAVLGGIIVGSGLVAASGTLANSGVLTVAGRSGNVTLSASDISGLGPYVGLTIPSTGLVVSNGTTLSAATLSGNFSFSGGTLDLPSQQRYAVFQVPQFGTMDNAQVLMMVGVSGLQHLRIPTNLAGWGLVFNSDTSGTGGWPAASTNLVVSTKNAGTWTAQCTITIASTGTVTWPTQGSIDLTSAGQALRVAGQATADTGFKDFVLIAAIEKIS